MNYEAKNFSHAEWAHSNLEQYRCSLLWQYIWWWLWFKINSNLEQCLGRYTYDDYDLKSNLEQYRCNGYLLWQYIMMLIADDYDLKSTQTSSRTGAVDFDTIYCDDISWCWWFWWFKSTQIWSSTYYRCIDDTFQVLKSRPSTIWSSSQGCSWIGHILHHDLMMIMIL